MITGELKSQVDAVWNAFWSGGISNPLEVIEQITYLLFIKRLDDLHTLREKKANVLKSKVEDPIFSPKQQNFRWSRFKNLEARKMFEAVDKGVFPFIKTYSGEETTYAHFMKDARFTIPSAALLAKVVDLIDQIPMEDRDTKGDVYEYMLGKIASAGMNGQFRTPRHIIKMMTEMVAPKPTDIVCDPACGTAGFLIAVNEYLRENHKEIFQDKNLKNHFYNKLFNGFDFDNTMLRIGSMNMMLHGIDNPNIRHKDSLAEEHAGDEEIYSIVLANPPFAGSLDYETCAADLLSTVRTKKTELLFVALFERLLKSGGRAVVIVPSGVLESDSTVHRIIRRRLVEQNRLEAVIALPHWVFKPYASVATCILVFQKASRTDKVWFYRIDNDGFSDGSNKVAISGSDLPELLNLWKHRELPEYKPLETKHRFVSIDDIRKADYDLCHRAYLSGYRYPEDVPLRKLGEMFDIVRGNTAASSAVPKGAFIFATTSAELKTADTFQIDGEAIIIPTVSSTGHGHASIKTIHYTNGKTAIASICVALVPNDKEIDVRYVYYYLLRFKDQLLVPLMRGSANVSLDPERLAELLIPIPSLQDQTRFLRDIVDLDAEIAMLERGLHERIEKHSVARNAFGGRELGLIVNGEAKCQQTSHS